MNQSKLKVVKQERARINIDILGVSELKWTAMGEFNSDDHYIYYCGQESLRRNWSSRHSQQELKMQYLGAVSKMTGWSECFQGKPYNTTVIQVYATDAEEVETEEFCEDL